MLITPRLAAPPTPPASGGSDKVDFSDGINNPTEVLLMPVADTVAGLIVGQQFDGNAHVQVSVNDGQQELSYDMRKPRTASFSVPGEINGEKFKLDGKVDVSNMSVGVKGSTPAGDAEATIEPGAGEIGMKGKFGTVEFNQTVEIQLGFPPTVNISGKIGGEDYKIKSGEDGASFSGNLGSKDVAVKVERGPHGSILVHQQIGDNKIEEIISRL